MCANIFSSNCTFIPTHQVEKDKASDTFAELTVDDMTEIHVFNARNELPERMAHIKALAKEPISEETCSSLLSQLLTSCHKDSCTSANTDMYQQSVNQVCSFVDTQIKIKTKTVGQFFDFQRYTVQLGTPHSSIFKTPLDEKRAVACCKDDVPVGEEETWYKSPLSKHDTCPYVLRQRWTGEAPISALPVSKDFYRLTSNKIGDVTDTFEHYSPPSHTWIMKGKGQMGSQTQTIINHLDIIYYASTEMQGSTETERKDFDIRINVQPNSPDSSNENHRSGLMVRGSLNEGARNFALMFQGNQLQTSYRDNTRTGRSLTILCGDKIPVEEGIWLRITRFATNYRSWYSTESNPSSKSWTELCHHPFSRDNDWNDYMVSGSVHVGIAIGAGRNDVLVGRNFTIYGNCVSNECMSDDGYPAIGTPPEQIKIEGYTSYNQRICNNDNQFFEVDGFGEQELLENDFIRISDIAGCASECDAQEDCTSFDFFGDSCRLSSSCDHYSLTDPNPASIWYFKHIPPPRYEYFESVRCSDYGDLEVTNTNTLQECANLCSEEHRCVSVAYQKKGSTQCLLSSTCTDYGDMVDDEDDWNT